MPSLARPNSSPRSGRSVSRHQRSLRVLQWTSRLPRMLFVTVLCVTVAVGLRTMLRPQVTPVVTSRARTAADGHEAEALAEAFARVYLTWDARQPDSYAARIRPFLPGAVESDGGVTLPRSGRQSVRWTTVAQDLPTSGGRLIRIDADTTAGSVSLDIDIRRGPSGALSLAGYPAVVGASAVDRTGDLPTGDAVNDVGLATTVRRAMRNYLLGRRDALAADLAPGAVVVVPTQPMQLRGVDELTWRRLGREVAVLLRAAGRPGAELTLGYAVGVERGAGRWFVRWIGTKPSTERTP